jgi:hypothetical protein
VQVQAQYAVLGATAGGIVEGCGWAADWRGGLGPVVTHPVERNDAIIATIREAAEEGMERVRALKARV